MIDVELPMSKLRSLPLLVVAVMGCLYTTLVFTGSITSAYGAERNLVPSYGSGRYQLFIFSDYFCQPCQRLEKEIDYEIHELIAKGGVKVTFVDLPIYKLTPLYTRYFLYAVHASKSYKEALLARNVLFDTASRIGAITEPQLDNALKARNIAMKPYDVEPALKQYNDIVRKYMVRGTPMFVFVYSPADVRKYSGSQKIKEGLVELRKVLEHPN
jgi:protein-disulfide isomerase